MSRLPVNIIPFCFFAEPFSRKRLAAGGLFLPVFRITAFVLGDTNVSPITEVFHMIRIIPGTERRMIRIRTAESRTFSEAYLVLRRRARRTPIRDIVAEAGRVIRDCERRDRALAERRRRRILAFLIGLLAGVATTASAIAITLLALTH